MTKTIKYTGAQDAWPELAITGKQSVWHPGQQEERADPEAEILLTTGLFSLLHATAESPATVTPTANRILTLPEGMALTIKPTEGSSDTAGVAYLLDQALGGTNSKQSWQIGATALAPISGYEGTQKVLITCTAGSIDATVGEAVVKVYAEATPEMFGAIGNGIDDDTTAFQNALNASTKVVGKPTSNYKITKTLVVPSGARQFDGNNCKITASFGTAYSTPIFSNNKVTDASTDFLAKHVKISGNCVGVDFRFTADSPNAGLKLKLSDIDYQTGDGNRRAGTCLFIVDQLDFSDFEKLTIGNCDFPFSIGSAPPRRNCTQISVKNVYVSQVNSGPYLAGIDKAELSKVDIANCASGWCFGPALQRIDMLECHVEGLSITGYALDKVSGQTDALSAGYGYYFTPSVQNSQITLKKCSFIDVGGTGGVAKGGVYIGRCDNPDIQDITFDDCSIAKTASGSSSYVPFTNRGKFKWNGRWPFTNEASLSADGFGYIDMVINDPTSQLVTSGNLLAGNTALSLIDGSATNPPTITETSSGFLGTTNVQGHSVLFQAQNYEFMKTVNLPYGWNTVDVTGYKASGGITMRVEQNGSPFTDIMRVQFNNQSDNQRRTRISFWNPTPNQSYKFGFISANAAGTDRMVLTEGIAVYPGFAQPTPPRLPYEVVAALPTASSRWLNRTVIVRASGVADAVWTCLRDASGAAVWVAK